MGGQIITQEVIFDKMSVDDRESTILEIAQDVKDIEEFRKWMAEQIKIAYTAGANHLNLNKPKLPGDMINVDWEAIDYAKAKGYQV